MQRVVGRTADCNKDSDWTAAMGTPSSEDSALLVVGVKRKQAGQKVPRQARPECNVVPFQWLRKNGRQNDGHLLRDLSRLLKMYT